MRSISRLLCDFLKKSPKEQGIYFEAFFLLGICRLAIITLPFKRIAPLLGRHMEESPLGTPSVQNKNILVISKGIKTVSRFVPWKCKCLVQAITAKKMLDRRGIKSTLYLGVASTKDSALIAHAWVRTRNLIVCGDYNLPDYTVVSIYS